MNAVLLRFLGITLLFSAPCFVVLPSFAMQAATCYNSARAQAYENAIPLLNTVDFKTEICKTNSSVLELYKVFDFISDLKFSKSPYRYVTPGIVKTSYKDFLFSNVKSILIRSEACNSKSLCVSAMLCPNGKKCASPIDGGQKNFELLPGEMVIYPNFFDHVYYDDILLQASVLIHEARHWDGFQHVKCLRGSFKGATEACDVNFERGGAYATQAEFYSRVFLDSTNVSAYQRYAARVEALNILANRFNTVPHLNEQNIALLRTPKGNMYKFDGRQLTSLNVSVDPQSDLFYSGNGMAIAMAKSRNLYYERLNLYAAKNIKIAPEVPARLLRTLADFYGSWSEGQRHALKEIIALGDEYSSASLMNHQIFFQLSGRSFLVDVTGKSISHIALQIPNCGVHANGIFAISEDREIYAVNQDTKTIIRTVCTWPQDVRAYRLINGHHIYLSNVGHLFEVLPDGSKKIISSEAPLFDQMTSDVTVLYHALE